MIIIEYDNSKGVSMETLKIIKALGDENRLRIVNILFGRELCVCEVEGILSMTQSNISRHLSKLTSSGVTKYRKDAKYIYYSLEEKTLVEHPFIAEAIKDFRGEERYMEDLVKLNRYVEHGYTCDDVKDNVLLFLNR